MGIELTEIQWLAIEVGLGVLGVWLLLAVVAYALRTSRKPASGGTSDASGWLRRLHREPAAIGGFIGACVALAAAFGFNLDGEQVGAITAFTVFLIGFIVRYFVTPVAEPRLE